MRGETEWTGFQTIHFPLRKIHMDSFRIFSTFGSTIFFKKNMSAPYIREQKITVEFWRKWNCFSLWNIIFFFFSLLSVVDPE